MSPDTPSRWDSPRIRAVRSAAVLVAAIAGTAGYAVFLNGRAYKVKDWLFWRVGAIWLYGLFLSLACLSAGHLALTRLFRATRLPTLETVVHAVALGLITFVLGMYVGGALRQFNAVFAIAWPAVMLAAGARPLWRFYRERRADYEEARHPRRALETGVAAIAAIFGVIGVLFVYLGVFTPDAINFDSSWCHMTVAADYARAGRLIPFVGDYAKTVPHLASIAQTWAFIVPGLSQPVRWMMALHLEFFFFLWTLAGVAAMARWLLGADGEPEPVPARSTWAAFFLFPAIFVYDYNLGGAADHWLAFFTAPFFLASMRAMRDFDARACALAGAFAAGAVLTKYQAMYPIFGVGLVLGVQWLRLVIARVRADRQAKKAPAAPPPLAAESVAMMSSADPAIAAPPAPVDAKPAPAIDAPSLRQLILGPLVLIAALLLISSPHFLKNLVFYKNPVYPFAQDLFKGSSPTTANAAFLFEWLFKDYNWRPHGTLFQNLRDGLGLVFSFSFVPHYSFTKNVPVTGALFTLSLPFLFFIRSPKRLWLGAASCLGALFLWAMTFRVDRNLQTFMPFLAATTAGLLVRAWELGATARLGLVPLVGLQVIWGGDAYVYSSHQRIKAAIDMIRGGYEGKRDDRFNFRAEFRDLGKALPPNAKLILHNYRPNLGIDREILLDWPGQQGLILYDKIHNARELYDYWRSLGVTHLVHIPGRRPTTTKQDDILFTEFVAKYSKSRKRFGTFELVELPAEPPPASAPYEVLAIGLAGYKDGLYPIDKMKAYESMPKHVLSWPAPASPLPRDEPGVAALVEKVDVVVEGRNAKFPPAAKDALNKSFSIGLAYSKSFTIWIRKGQGGAAAPAPHGSPTPTGHPPESPEDDDEQD